MIFDAIRVNPKITQIDLAERIGVAYRTLKRKMDEMKKSGIIMRIGGKRYGHWKINE